jgi:hypothetical protein
MFYKNTKFENKKKHKGTFYLDGKIYFVTNRARIPQFKNKDFENICNYYKKMNFIIEEETEKYIQFCQIFER